VEAEDLIRRLLESDLTPTVLDLHNGGGDLSGTSRFELVVGFAGTGAEVDWQIEQSRMLGLDSDTDLTYDKHFWDDRAATAGIDPWSAWQEIRKLSVLPSELCKSVADLGPVSFVARAGNGIIYYRGGTLPPKSNVPRPLMERIKSAYDPKHLLAELPV
jgi:hypothetical protein